MVTTSCRQFTYNVFREPSAPRDDGIGPLRKLYSRELFCQKTMELKLFDFESRRQIKVELSPVVRKTEIRYRYTPYTNYNIEFKII